MSFIVSTFKDWIRHWHVFADGSRKQGQRICALLEFICFPVSLLIIITMLAQLPLRHFGIELPEWWTLYAMKILASAAIGYLTNWLAIEMLFKPFHENKWHPFSLLTFGWGRLGMIPKNKPVIAKAIAKQVKNRLLNPEELAAEFCGTIMSVAENPANLEFARQKLQGLLMQNEKSITAYFIPQIEQTVTAKIDELLTQDRILAFWTDIVEPKLKSQETRDLVAGRITNALKDKAPQIITIIRAEIRVGIADFIAQKIPFFAGGAQSMADMAVESIDWNSWEQKLSDRLASEDTAEMLRQEVEKLAADFCAYLHSEEATDKIQAAMALLKDKLAGFFREYLYKEVPLMLDKLLNSEQLWRWFEQSLLPNLAESLRAYINGDGKNVIIEKLNIEGRVENAINRQQIEEFYEMINDISAQHLGAIQIIGFFLGAVIGVLQIFI